MRTSPLHVALVEDDLSVCRSLERLLRAAGITSASYGSAEAFLAERHPPPFDCLVLDICMGGMSGVELALWLAAEGNRTPVIYVTAYDDPETRKRAESVGGAFFRKSDSGEHLVSAIRRLADRDAEASQ